MSTEGAGALWLLAKLRVRARCRGFLRSLRRPRRVILVLFFALVAGFLIFARTGGKGGVPGEFFGVFLLFFVVATVVGTVGNGAITFTPAEVHFFFPAPIGTRALICSHLVSGALKSASGALVFSLFIPPRDAPFLQVLFGYVTFFMTLVALGAVVDLRCLGLSRSARRRLALSTCLGLALLAGGVVYATWRIDGVVSPALVRHLGLPAAPFVVLIGSDDGGAVLLDALLLWGLIAALVCEALRFKGDIREAAMATGARLRARLKRSGMAGPPVSALPARTRGQVLPMPPRLGGAGVHLWRQLTTLIRQRRSFGMLIFACAVFAGTFTLMTPAEFGGEFLAVMVLAIVATAGPFYVQCDFRSDHEALAWLKSLPTGATALAAGQMLASVVVLYVIQLLLGGWVILVAPPERRLLWAGVLLALPAVDLLQLCVENGAWLLYPHKLNPAHGTPGLVDIARMYALVMAKMLVMVLALATALVPAVLVHVALERPVVTGLVGLLSLHAAALAHVWIVGRIFIAVDPGRDLADH